MSTPPRGERNRNPCNLEDFGIPWEGLTGHDPDNYCTFDTDEHGVRAGARDLHTKVVLHGLNTLNKLVPVFAPKSENNVPAYVKSLSDWTHWGPDDILDLHPPSNLQLLVTGVIHQECGRVIYSEDLIGQAVVDALMSNAVQHLSNLSGGQNG